MGLVLIDSSILDATDECSDRQIVSVWTGSQQNLYVFYIDSNADLVYRKSTDQGASWSAVNIIATTEDYSGVAVWYDRWTRGDTTGNTIHIISTQTTNNKAVYFSLGVDDDLAETNNAVDILSVTTLQPDGGGMPCICKAQSGNLFVCFNASNVDGVHLAKSTDAGAIWADITSPAGGADWAVDHPFGEDRTLLCPLNTDDDILAVTHDESADTIGYHVYDEVADEWETRVDFGMVRQSVNIDPQQFTICPKKATGDVMVCGTRYQTKGGIESYFFSDSSRTMSLARMIRDFSMLNVATFSRRELRGACVGWYEPTSTWIFMCYEGDVQASMSPVFWISNDDGVTWSHTLDYRNQDLFDDFRFTTQPAVYLNANEGISPIVFDDDDNDIFTLKERVQLEAITGVVKDNAGVAVVGAEVKIFRSGMDNLAFDREPYMGSTITDGSGNYSAGIVARNSVGGADHYYAVATDRVQQGPNISENFKLYAYPFLTQDGYDNTGGDVVHDSANNELDFDAGVATAGKVTLDTSEILDSQIKPISEDSFLLRFKIRLVTITQGSSSTRSGFYVYVAQSNITPDGSSRYQGIRFTIDNVNGNLITAISSAAGGDVPSAATVKSDFARTLTAETLYVEIKKTSRTSVTVSIYSDEFDTLLESETIAVADGTTSMRYIVFGVEGGDALHSLDGAVEWFQFWNIGNNTAEPKAADANDASLSKRTDF